MSQDVVNAAWERSHTAQRKDVAWVAALLTSSLDVVLQPHTPLHEISHTKLVQAQREDPTIGEALRLKEMNDKLQSVEGAASKVLHEWNRLHLEDGILYQRKPERKQLVLSLKYQPLVLKHLHDNMGHVGLERPPPRQRKILLVLYEKTGPCACTHEQPEV